VALNNGAPRIATGPSIASRLAASAINKRALERDDIRLARIPHFRCRAGGAGHDAVQKESVQAVLMSSLITLTMENNELSRRTVLTRDCPVGLGDPPPSMDRRGGAGGALEGA
jgi:hypothetical protein